MDFDYTDEQRALQDESRRILTARCTTQAFRRVADGGTDMDRELWAELGKLGWLGAAIPQEYGGQGLDNVSFCAVLEEVGRVIAPLPLGSSIYLAAQAILFAGNEAQKRALLPKAASGDRIAAFALDEAAGGTPMPSTIATIARQGKLYGKKPAVDDGMVADFAVVVAKDEHGEIGLYAVNLDVPGVTRTRVAALDLARSFASIAFDGAAAERLDDADGWETVQNIVDRAAIFTAFEQLGGAERCLDLARDYALNRYAFGRPIASFQAIKHKLADVFVAKELARSAAYYGAWALDSGTRAEQAKAAAIARLTCTEAFETAAREFIQVSGGIAMTWAYDAHLFYRRARHLAAVLGGRNIWRNRLVARIEAERRQMRVA